MKIVLATSNRGKMRELKEAMSEYEIINYNEVIEPFEIIENGDSFKENALIKANAVYKKLEDKNVIVLADDSGISLPILNNKPGIHSARFAGANATSEDNMLKVIDELKKRKIKKTKAFYTASIAIVSKKGESTVHGWMYGDVIDEYKGSKGFGYDPIFIPKGFDKTLGELPNRVKQELSHRTKAINLIKKIL